MSTHNILLCCVLSLESPHTIYCFQYKQENHPELSQICNYGIFKGFNNKFETTMVNKPSVFEPRRSSVMPLAACTSNKKAIIKTSNADTDPDGTTGGSNNSP